jgi:hypothetical protein
LKDLPRQPLTSYIGGSIVSHKHLGLSRKPGNALEGQRDRDCGQRSGLPATSFQSLSSNGVDWRIRLANGVNAISWDVVAEPG